ncbi:hypothetical protein H2203_007197 [Taxawa tesnikishii (nom. ined.)]|nr:hypothetical protein H2203_007197 [Dothideales sp. JES 119]
MDHTLDLTLPKVAAIIPTDDLALRDQVYIPYSIIRFQWSNILSQIKRYLYRFPDPAAPPPNDQDVQALQQELRVRLENWLAEGVNIVKAVPQPERVRLNTKLEMDYHAAMCLLYQPSQVCRRPTNEALQQCLNSAVKRLRLYGLLYEQNHLYMSWPTAHGVFLTGATVLYCIWSSLELRASASLSSLAKDFRLCSSLLAMCGEWWPLIRQGRNSFDRLADLTLRVTAENPNIASDAPARSMEPFPGATQPQMDAVNGFGTTIESLLQSFLQYELQFPEIVDSLNSADWLQEDVDSMSSGIILDNQFAANPSDLCGFE